MSERLIIESTESNFTYLFMHVCFSDLHWTLRLRWILNPNKFFYYCCFANGNTVSHYILTILIRLKQQRLTEDRLQNTTASHSNMLTSIWPWVLPNQCLPYINCKNPDDNWIEAKMHKTLNFLKPPLFLILVYQFFSCNSI